MLDSYAKDPNPSGMWIALAKEKQAVVHAQIESLEQMDRILSELLKCRCATLDECVKNSVSDPRLKRNVS